MSWRCGLAEVKWLCFDIIESCRADNLLSNDIKYVMIG